MTGTTALIVAASYLLGAVPFGLLIGRALGGVDPRAAGSGNIGATNVARTAGVGWGVLTFALDFAKGVAGPVAASVWGPDLPWLPVVAGLAAILGHVFPIWLRFRGGKGVATAAGAFAALAPAPFAVALAVFGVVAGLTRTVALGSMSSALALVIACFVAATPWAVRGLAIAAALLIFVRHTGNIRRLFDRERHGASKVGEDAAPRRGPRSGDERS